MASFMLSTIDNPFNPFTNFLQWFMFDEQKGYHSSSYLGRIARTSEQLTDEENEKEIERAINEILKYDFLGLYVRVKEGDVIRPSKSPILVESGQAEETNNETEN